MRLISPIAIGKIPPAGLMANCRVYGSPFLAIGGWGPI